MTKAKEKNRTLQGTLSAVAHLSRCEMREMFELLDVYFENLTETRFAKDLAEKDSVILLRDGDGRLQGFSTLMRLEARVQGVLVTAFFSGDTIVAHRFWGQTELTRLWGQYAFDEAAKLRKKTPGVKVYWLLISSGYKTYRFLPVAYRNFFPSHLAQTPSFEQAVMHTLAGSKFDGEYDRGRGVVRFREAAPLRQGIADIEARRLKDPHVRFFLQMNPGHKRGDELVCLAELHPANLTPAGKRLVGALDKES
ncbi:MAG: hypothetical protein JSV66_06900 [Trueperaceae bacterium]|nr:MAG: hypothetical protein JSV66_06900 [Trueperaceae bacterium]